MKSTVSESFPETLVLTPALWFGRLLDLAWRHLNQRAETAVAGTEGLHRKDVYLLCSQLGQHFRHRARMVFAGDLEPPVGTLLYTF